jgi:regulation of enolase protein 1 (concanavalin A-like superfamily)
MTSKRSLLAASGLVITLILFYSVSCASAAVGSSDEFTSATMNSFWSTAGSGTATFSLTANPGYMRITCPANLDIGGSNDNAPQLLQTVTGDFAVTTKVTGVWTAAGTHAGLIVWKDSTHFMRVEVRDTNKVQIGGKNGGTFVSTSALMGSAVNPVYLKLDKTGTTITGYWSSDGVTWTNFGSFTMTGADPVKVGLFVINQNASPATYSADFDYFHFVAGGITVLPESPIAAIALPIAVLGAFLVYRVKPFKGKFRLTS